MDMLAFLVLLILAGLFVRDGVRWGLRRRREAVTGSVEDVEASRAEGRVQRVRIAGEALREHDPDFDAARFLERVRHAFLAVQEARSTGELARARAFVSDGIHERLANAITEWRILACRRELRDVVVEDAQLALVQSGANFDELTVALRARARLRQVRDGDEAAPPGDGIPIDAGGFWTFLRRRGAKTKAGPGLLEGHCPNCGAPIALLESAICESCRSKLRSGEHDWVLSEITHSGAWHPRAGSRIPGVPELLADDPGFSVVHLEDRVGVIFWRRLLAERQGGAQRLEAMAHEDFCARFAAEHPAHGPATGHGGSTDVEIQAINVTGVKECEGWHRVAVLVQWAGQRLERQPRGGLQPTGGPVDEITILVLARRVGARTQLADAISSAHCPGCGAPETGTEGARCAFCGIVLNDGTTDWILVDAMPVDSDEGQECLREFVVPGGRPASDAEPSALPPGAFAWLVRVMCADGTPEPQVTQMLARVSQRLGAGFDEPLEWLASSDDVRRALVAIVDLCIAYGGVGEARREALRELAERGGLTPVDVRMAIHQRTRLWEGREEVERRIGTPEERPPQHHLLRRDLRSGRLD
ncbi:MAG: Tim44-like domain-containing protein [Myxococcota bacterium]|nr:Tim44-like domain-containing protein [Myxococcota bacterium]